jgi:hypothetical protein
MEYLKIILPASIALLGTIITVLIGYRQWKRQQETSRYGAFVSERQSAYKGLWERLEAVHVKLRTDDINRSDFNDLVGEVNSYILQQSLYLDEHDQLLSNQYLKAVYKFREAVMDSGDAEAEEEMATTAKVVPRVTQNARQLRVAVSELERTRAEIIQRFRGNIGGA